MKAIIFDCFGVIIGKGFDYTYSTAGGDSKKDRQFVNDMLGQANLGLISEKEFNETMAKHLGITESEWQDAVKAAEQADQELLKFIGELKKQYKTAILSNSNTGVLDQKIGKENLSLYFDEVVSSAEVGLIKPDPDIYLLTAKRLGVDANDCVFIDDHKSYVKVARELGMVGILYTDLPDLKHELEEILSH